MLVSTRGRYALRVVIDLAENANGGYIPMKAAEGASGLYVGGDFAADGGNSGAGQLRGALFGALRPGGRLPYSSHVAEAGRAD